MKNKLLLSILGAGLLISACGGNNTSSSKNSSSPIISSTSTSSSKVSEVTSQSSPKVESFFSEEDLALLNGYFNFDIPYVNLEYSLLDYTSQAGGTYVSIEFNNANTTSFEELKTKLSNAFTFDGEEDYEGVIWYCYSYEDFLIDTCYDDFSYDTPCIYLEICDKNLETPGEGGDYEEEIKEAVDGYFDAEDTALLESMFNFDIPFVGDYYELYDYSDIAGYDYVIIYFDYVDETDFTSILNTLKASYNFDGTEDYEGLTYHMFSVGNYYIDVAFDEEYEYPYIVMDIYINSEDEGGSGGNIDTPVEGEKPFENGSFAATDAAWLNSKFGFVVPCVGETYEISDWTDYVGFDYALVYFNNVSEDEFNSYINTLKTQFTYDGTENYEGLTYYLFSIGDYCIDVAFDDEYEYPYLVMDIYLNSEDEGGNDDDYEGGESGLETPIVNGQIDASDKSMLQNRFGFSVPAVGTSYEIYDYTADMGYDFILIYFNYVSETDYNSYLNTLKAQFTYDGNEVDEGLTYELFSTNEYYIDVAYDATGYDYPYVALYIYAAE